MLARLILLAVLAVIVWRLLQRWRISITPVQPPRSREEFEPMARCASCGVHLPAAALSPDGRCGKCAAQP